MGPSLATASMNQKVLSRESKMSRSDSSRSAWMVMPSLSSSCCSKLHGISLGERQHHARSDAYFIEGRPVGRSC